MDEEEEEDAEWAREMAEEEADRQRKAEPAPAISREEFLAWRAVRLGDANPTSLDNPLWHWLVRTRWSAFQANEIFKGPSPFDSGPMWCFDRFGKSETPLPDGRVVHIGGEHEDFYDPDFFIYNDVTVIAPDGSITLLGYPHELFAPTDFHTATLVGSSIFVIGGLGYKHLRTEGTTPVFRLNLASMAMQRIPTTGDAPGWIREHSAERSEDGLSIVVRGGEVWRGPDRTGRGPAQCRTDRHPEAPDPGGAGAPGPQHLAGRRVMNHLRRAMNNHRPAAASRSSRRPSLVRP